MASLNPPADPEEEDVPEALDADEAAEEITGDSDVDMDSDADEDGNDDLISDPLAKQPIAHFDSHNDSIYSIAQHPTIPLIATGSGDHTAYTFLLPKGSTPQGSELLEPLQKFTGHTDSVTALGFTYPSGSYLLTAGLDGQLRSYHLDPSSTTTAPQYTLITSTTEVPEINFLLPSPSPAHPDTFALGASDGSVWVYSCTPSSLDIQQAYYLHTAPVTAGAWSADGLLLATVCEEGSLYVWDVFSEAAAQGLVSSGGQAAVALTAADARFAVDGGLYSVAIAPTQDIVAVGGAGGVIKLVSIPRLSSAASGGPSKPKSKSKQKTPPAGQILHTLSGGLSSIETLAFSPPHPNLPARRLLASGSADGSLCLFDASQNFSLRRRVTGAHEEEAVVQLKFEGSEKLVSAGMDGVLRVWDLWGGTPTAASTAATATAGGVGTAVVGELEKSGLVRTYRGHRGDGEGGGILAFVLLKGERVTRAVTAGDDGLALVFEEAEGVVDAGET
ncbi:MAG: hypothetical protein M1824_001575 [Vezdaea acicularis]|nr:MAG: hypothetical protein M1824_001575 [Vezdaea acicularis]